MYTSSWHARLFRYSYGTYTNLPKNLCPYFWNIALAIILIIPITVFYLPYWAVYYWGDYGPLDKDEFKNDGKISWIIFPILLLYIVIILTVSMISMWFVISNTPYSDFEETILFFGVCGWAIVITGIISYINSGSRPKYLFIEVIKAKYNKYCPKITWIEKTKTP